MLSRTLKSKKTYLAVLLGLALVLGLNGPLQAVVNQVDGQVVPDQTGCPAMNDGCVQAGLNLGEGQARDTPIPLIDAVLDANTGPETFLIPQLAGQFVTVQFRLIQEGAGFENIFGWYNVDEPAKRFPAILSCAFNSRSDFEPDDNSGTGGYITSIDFQAEFVAGRYKGGQIGFYLVTPEGSFNREPSEEGQPWDSCATDPDDQGTLSSGGPIDDDSVAEGDGHDDDNGFGRVYYTESSLNNDGNYVHYLVYRSVANPQAFYFGFEDLFRGGDNDYEDTFVKVTGLVPSCEPKQEVCNGVDDNCNGQVDENVFRPCSTACGLGQQLCVNFSNDGNDANDWGSCSAQKPVPEVCNGLDDDCNGTVDDGLVGVPCVSGGCPGTTVCRKGSWACDAPPPATEVCDGKDNDCNKLVDDGVTRSCTSICGAGVERCAFSDDGNAANDWTGCDAPKPAPEICDGKDNDCNGKVDDAVPGVGASCTAADGCAGVRVCRGSAGMACDAPARQAEICDGKDNDCNGKIDDGVFRSCSTACGVGRQLCQFVDDGNPNNDWGACDARLPATETCNGLDDDCDGRIDNDLPPGRSCTVGGCLGKEVCKAGKWVCDAPLPGEETCDGLDNNCDGQIDENLVRSCRSACGTGQQSCKFTDDGDPSNDWGPCSAKQPEAELCDGVDNDCNGIVDDGVPGAGVACDDPSGQTCGQGEMACVGGTMVCVGADLGSAEVCDCKDNNCNGQVDEGDLCPSGTSCVECGCRISCRGSEFACPKGYACTNGFCLPDKCVGISCPVGSFCRAGACVNPCDGVQCASGEVCQRGACVADNCYGKGCPLAGQVCLENSCQDHPCAGVRCALGQYCSDGFCKSSCGRVACGAGGRCVDGRCVAGSASCAGDSCGAGIPCNGGLCDSACAGVHCLQGQVCRAGSCMDDPCSRVRCPQGERCAEGQCLSDFTSSGSRTDLLATGGGGFSCAVGGTAAAPSPPWPWLLLLLGWCWRRARQGGVR